MLSERYNSDSAELLSPIRSDRPISAEFPNKEATRSGNDAGSSGGDSGSGNRTKEETTMKRLGEALEKSEDQGDTLDLSRRRIEVIGEEAVIMFRKGVGKDHKGVWRYVRLSDQSDC